MKLFNITLTALTVSLMSFAPHAFAADKGTIGISMPTKSSARWIADGDNIVKTLRAKGVGYGTAGLPMPVVTGQDCEVQSIKSSVAHEQRSSIFKDTRELAKIAASMVDALLSGT